MVTLEPVVSTMIAAVGYSPELRTLYVLYNGGRVYEYYDVPPEVYQQLMQAESKGSYMNFAIKKNYPYGFFQGWPEAREAAAGSETAGNP